MFMDVLPTCMMHHVCAVHMETRYSGTIVTDNCSLHVGVGNWIQVLCRTVSAHNCGAISTVPGRRFWMYLSELVVWVLTVFTIYQHMTY